mmetsp:Transcript_33269/g.85409  ORF Transcript_33269/g.85409 Transcript_33269/m.85409 type:complete len:492 (+) Transcript_33269:725-2200(+)
MVKSADLLFSSLGMPKRSLEDFLDSTEAVGEGGLREDAADEDPSPDPLWPAALAFASASSLFLLSFSSLLFLLSALSTSFCRRLSSFSSRRLSFSTSSGSRVWGRDSVEVDSLLCFFFFLLSLHNACFSASPISPSSFTPSPVMPYDSSIIERSPNKLASLLCLNTLPPLVASPDTPCPSSRMLSPVPPLSDTIVGVLSVADGVDTCDDDDIVDSFEFLFPPFIAKPLSLLSSTTLPSSTPPSSCAWTPFVSSLPPLSALPLPLSPSSFSPSISLRPPSSLPVCSSSVVPPRWVSTISLSSSDVPVMDDWLFLASRDSSFPLNSVSISANFTPPFFLWLLCTSVELPSDPTERERRDRARSDLFRATSLVLPSSSPYLPSMPAGGALWFPSSPTRGGDRDRSPLLTASRMLFLCCNCMNDSFSMDWKKAREDRFKELDGGRLGRACPSPLSSPFSSPFSSLPACWPLRKEFALELDIRAHSGLAAIFSASL